MRAFTSVDSVKLLVVFSLFLVFGCAQNAYSVKDAGPGTTETATLLGVSVSGEGKASKVEILADKPLTYTYYSLKEPYRTVIDLSQANAGTVTAPSLDGSSIIKKIDIEKNELTTGSLVRITIVTAEETEFASVADSSDKSKLVFSVVSAQIPEAPRQAESAPLAASVLKEENKTATQDNLAKTEVAQDPAFSAEAKKPIETSNPPVNTTLTVTSLDVVHDGIVIQAGGPIEKYKYFTLTKPQRLAIDIFDVKSGFSSKSVSLNTLGIATARLGTYPDKVRIVFDSPKTSFPPFKLEKTENGLKLVLRDLDGARAPDAAHERASAASTTAPEEYSQPKGTAMVEAIDFKIVDGYSRISVTTSGECVLDGPAKTGDGLVLTFGKCTLPKKLQRPFDTSAFASVVRRLTPYQTRVKGRQDTKILITLREDAPFTLKREGEVVNLDIKNPEIAQSPAIVSGKNVAPVISTAPLVVETKPKYAQESGKHQNVSPGQRSEKKVYTGKRVTLEFADADIRKIFQLIAEVSNYNILVGDDVTGTISIKLVNVPWDQALDVILDTKGLGMKRKDNIIVIRPLGKITSLADEEIAAQKAYEKTLELQTKIFDVNYASVSDLAGQFNTYKSERGTISVDARTNRVIVNDIGPRIEKMASLLKYLDIPEKQVLIEARIVEATSTFTQDLGIQWGIHYRDGSASLLGINKLDTGFGGLITNLPPTTGFPAAGTAGGAMGISFGKLTSNVQVDLRLSAAAENGEIKIISTPKVVTLNNKAAKISQGQMIPYSTVSAEGTKTEFIEAALTLEVTPHITADGGVSMKIKATNNSAGSAAAGVAPPINKKEATTELLVQNGETTVIGGIYVDSDSNTDSGVPYLKDIPLLGWLFKSNNQKKSKSELLIFITPKIVS
ncbi:MAG: type IV pilus secretin family protein [Deltaproteobacteria bacterium]|nr:type IV pilus secretin family protein [Deltaproteobacteria bacterium]